MLKNISNINSFLLLLQEILKSLSKRGAEPLSPPESDDDSDYEDNMVSNSFLFFFFQSISLLLL